MKHQASRTIGMFIYDSEIMTHSHTGLLPSDYPAAEWLIGNNIQPGNQWLFADVPRNYPLANQPGNELSPDLIVKP